MALTGCSFQLWQKLLLAPRVIVRNEATNLFDLKGLETLGKVANILDYYRSGPPATYQTRL